MPNTPDRNVLEPREAPAPRPPIRRRLGVVVGGGTDNARRDAEAVARTLTDEYGFQLTWLLEGDATPAAVTGAIERDLDRADDGTQWLFYFAGHGTEQDGQGFLRLPAAGKKGTAALLSLEWLLSRCLRSACAEILLLLDACHAGHALVRREELDGPLSPDRELNLRVRQILCAGNPYQSVLDGGGEGHSVFTWTLLQALWGLAGAHDPSGALRFSVLRDHVVSAVESRLAADRLPEERRQTPIGGYFAGNAAQRDFTLCSLVPRVPSETVQELHSREPSHRLAGLTRLVGDARKEPATLGAAVVLAKKLAQPGGERTSPERIRATKALGLLARIGGAEREWPVARREVDAALRESLLALALNDPVAPVRDLARRGLQRTGGESRRRAAGLLLEKRRSMRGRARAAWEAIVWLPEARRELPWRARWRAPVTWGRLELAFLVRELTATKARRRALLWPLAAVLLLYLGLGSTYYISALNQSTLVVRSGHPGFKILPGVGQPVVVTDFFAANLREPGLARDERLRGFWLPLKGGALPWGEQIFEQLSPAEAGLAEWRMGDEERAFSWFRQGIDLQDAAVVSLLGYVAIQSSKEVRPAVGLLTQALAGGETLHAPALAALAMVRDAQPAAADDALAGLTRRLPGAPGSEAVAVLETVEALSERAVPAGLPAALTHLLRSHPGDAALRLRIARALKTLLERDPSRLAAILPDLRNAVLRGPSVERRAWFLTLQAPEPLPPASERLLLETLAAALAAETDPAERAALVTSLGRWLASSPGRAAPYVPVLAARLGDASSAVRLAAAQALTALPPNLPPAAPVIEALAALSRSGEPLDLRSQALEALGAFHPPGSQEAVLTALIAAAGEGNGIVRDTAVSRLVDHGFEPPGDARRVIPVLRRLLSDPVPSIRQQAAAGLSLLAEGPAAEAAFAEVVRALGSDDPVEARNMSSALAEHFPKSPGAPRRELLRRLAAHGRTLNVFSITPFLRLLEELGHGDSSLVVDGVLTLTELLSAPDRDADVPSLARNRLLELQRQPDSRLAPALVGLFARLHAPSWQDRSAAAEAVGILAMGHDTLAGGATLQLVPSLRSDPRDEVKAAAAEALGRIGSRRPLAASAVLEPLLAGLTTGAPPLRIACARALGNLEPAPALASRVVSSLLTALGATEPALRREAASAIVHWGRPNWRALGTAIPSLRRELGRETDPEARDRVAWALAVVGGGDPEIVRQVTSLAGTWLGSGEPQRRMAGVWLLRHLGESHPETGTQALAALLPLLRDPEEEVRRETLVNLYLIGTADVRNASAIADAVGPLLLDPGWPSRFDAVANNLMPMVRTHPSLAPRTVRWLRAVLADGAPGPPGSSLGTETAEALTEALAVQARTDPEALWPFLTSGRIFERQAARGALARLVSEHPERAPALVSRLAGYRRSLRPEVRLSAAEAVEMISILQRTDRVAGTPPAQRWRQILGELPRVGVDEAVRLALDRLEPGPPST